MPRLVILGSASAVPDADHENTHMVLHGDHSAVLIDCVGRPLVRLKQVGIDPDEVGDIILTHFHPDHVGGVPGFLMSTWLTGRTAPLRIYGLHHCLQRVEDLMMAYHWDEWMGFFPVAFHHLPEERGVHVLENADFDIIASPVKHYVPTIGVRVVAKKTGFVFAYSSDTVPTSSVVELARDADLLIHEVTADEPLGHSSASQAGTIAQEAGARALGLIHYTVWNTTPAQRERLCDDARTTFDGEVFLCEDFQEIPLRR